MRVNRSFKKSKRSYLLYMKKSERAIGSTVYEKELKSDSLYMKKSERAICSVWKRARAIDSIWKRAKKRFALYEKERKSCSLYMKKSERAIRSILSKSEWFARKAKERRLGHIQIIHWCSVLLLHISNYCIHGRNFYESF